jgi:hypothetical protein
MHVCVCGVYVYIHIHRNGPSRWLACTRMHVGVVFIYVCVYTDKQQKKTCFAISTFCFPLLGGKQKCGRNELCRNSSRIQWSIRQGLASILREEMHISGRNFTKTHWSNRPACPPSFTSKVSYTFIYAFNTYLYEPYIYIYIYIYM